MSLNSDRLKFTINLNSVLVTLVIALQIWMLLQLLEIRDRLTKVETKVEWWRSSFGKPNTYEKENTNHPPVIGSVVVGYHWLCNR